MKRRLTVTLLAVCLLLAALVPAAFATETEEEQDPRKGTCGEEIAWVLDDYTLTISGSGEMADGSPWESHKTHIEHVVFTGGITKIGADAFNGFDRIETVDFGDALVEIGERAFYGCEDIDVIHLPATFRIFGAEAFRNCYSLKYVYCDGGMPRFNDSCLWTGEYISVFYRTNNPWPAEAVGQLVSNFGGRLGVMMGNYEDSDVVGMTEETEAAQETEEVTQATEAVTEEATEATEEATEAAVVETVAATEPVQTEATVPETTEPPTQTTVPETTAAETEAPTEAPTQAETQTVETEPAQTEQEAAPIEQLRSNSWIGLVLIGSVLAFVAIGAIIFNVARKNGGRYNR